jgi:hypothetical protein
VGDFVGIATTHTAAHKKAPMIIDPIINAAAGKMQKWQNVMLLAQEIDIIHVGGYQISDHNPVSNTQRIVLQYIYLIYRC